MVIEWCTTCTQWVNVHCASFGSMIVQQQGGSARHCVHDGQKGSPSNCGAGTSIPSARSGARVEIPAIKVCRHVLARSRDGCM